MRNRWLLLAIAIPATAVAQDAPLPGYAIAPIATEALPLSLALFDAMDRAVDRVAPRVMRVDSGEALIGSIRQRTSWLRGRWKAANPDAKSDPIDFRRGLAYDVSVLHAAAADTSTPRVVAVLRDVNDDMVEKAEHCKQSPSGMATAVRVSIRTVANGLESPNWQVFYLPKIMEFASDPSDAALPFKVFSSPAVDDLAPGRYIVWARRPGQDSLVSERTTIRVGGGATAITQDIPVPR
jgi:hypothetical protein